MATLKQRVGAWLLPRLPVNRRTLSIVRYELNAMVTRLRTAIDPRIRKKIEGYRHQRDLRLNLGGGGDTYPGWVTIDVGNIGPSVLPLDIRRRLPFADCSVAQIYASHVLEHLEFREDVPFVLKELHRVLKRGGSVRIVVPDVVRFMDAYLSQDPMKWAALGVSTFPVDMPTPMTMINHVFHQDGEHQFAYDYETCQFVLRSAGFSEISRCQYRSSMRFDGAMDLEVHAPYSLYVEAVKA